MSEFKPKLDKPKALRGECRKARVLVAKRACAHARNAQPEKGGRYSERTKRERGAREGRAAFRDPRDARRSQEAQR